jgi:hypothetical protein
MLIFDLLSLKYKVTCSVDSPLFKGLMCVCAVNENISAAEARLCYLCSQQMWLVRSLPFKISDDIPKVE